MGDLRRRSVPATAKSAIAEATRPNLSSDEGPHIQPKYKQILVIGLICLCPYLYMLFYHYNVEDELRQSILINMAMSIGAFFATAFIIPVASKYVLRRNMFGYDINKKGSPQGSIKVPESLGLVTGVVYLVVAILFQLFNFTSDSIWLVEYNAALGSICFMLFLGFVDDVLDIPWRVKLFLPSIAALPLLMAYAGHTTILIPKPLHSYLGITVLDLGWIYKLYMFLLAVFCTNSINIHAGLNGLEVGQTIVISSAILIHNIMQIGLSSKDDYKQAHAFSIYLIQPLIGASLGLLTYNWYPSSVFVGDTFTYFAGMALAVVGILGHFRSSISLSIRRCRCIVEAFGGYYQWPAFEIVNHIRSSLQENEVNDILASTSTSVEHIITTENESSFIMRKVKLLHKCSECKDCISIGFVTNVSGTDFVGGTFYGG